MKLEGKYGKGSSKSELYAGSSTGESSWIEVDLPFGNAVFAISNYSSLMTDAYIMINKEKIPVDEYGETAAIGPVLFDGSKQATAVRF